jgi:glycosyltransferase involved in cell wall biosynthesis
LITVIPNGFDNNTFRPLTEDKTILRNRLGLEQLSGHFLIVCVGSIEPRMDFETVVSAIQELHVSGEKIALVVVGRGLSGNYEKELRKRCAHLPFVHFVGYVPDLSTVSLYLNSADACVAPYKPMLTNFGVTLKVLEYLAVGKPTFVTPIPDIVEELGECVLVYTSRRDLYCRLKAIISDRSAYRAIAQKGRARVMDFTWVAIANEYEKLLQEVVARVPNGLSFRQNDYAFRDGSCKPHWSDHSA